MFSTPAGKPGVVANYSSQPREVFYSGRQFAQFFAPEIGGRVNTASNVLVFGCSFCIQWGVGAVLRLYPVLDGRYAPEGYRAAFFALALLQLATIAWLFPLRVRSPAGA